jgi:hypothetical protein
MTNMKDLQPERLLTTGQAAWELQIVPDVRFPSTYQKFFVVKP